MLGRAAGARDGVRGRPALAWHPRSVAEEAASIKANSILAGGPGSGAAKPHHTQNRAEVASDPGCLYPTRYPVIFRTELLAGSRQSHEPILGMLTQSVFPDTVHHPRKHLGIDASFRT